MPIIGAPVRFELNEMKENLGMKRRILTFFPRDGIQALKSAEISERSSFMEKLVILVMTLSMAKFPFYLIFCNNVSRKTYLMRINEV